MKLIDTNVFVYAVGRPDPYKESCRKIMQALLKGAHQYLTDAEVLQEILHVYGKRDRREQGVELVEALIDAELHIIPIGTAEIVGTAQLLREYPWVDARDAIHAAVVQLHGLDGVVSADRGFDVIRGVTRFDPMEMYQG